MNIEALRKCLIKNKLLSTVRKVGEKRGEAVYLVGGYIRDQLLGKESNDYDFAVDGSALDFSRELAKTLKGKFILLDEETETARIVCRIEEGVVELDFKRLKEGDIIIDLRERDFTINTISVLLDLSKEFKLIDPFGGLKDLQNKMIKVTSSEVLSEDPLRMLRAFRLACDLGFEIEQNTLQYIKGFSELLSGVSPERVVSELFSILEVENSYTYITLLDEVGLLSAIIPEVSSLKLQHTSFWHHSFETFRLMEEWSGNLQNFFPRWHSRIEEYLVELIADNRSRLSALKFLSLLHPLNEVKPPSSIARIMRRLRLSNRECQLAAKMTESLHQANTFLITKKFTNKMLYSFFKKLGVDGIGVLFIALADTYQRKRGRKCFETIDEIFNKFYTQIFLTPLLNGRDIIEHFKLVSGPLIGKLLIKVEERRAEGEIKNRMEALQYVEELLKKRN